MRRSWVTFHYVFPFDEPQLMLTNNWEKGDMRPHVEREGAD